MGIARAEKYDIVVSHGDMYYRIAKVVFQRKDGSVIVSIPYFTPAQGLVCKALHPGGNPSVPIRLDQVGFTTSHLVKYNHHPDGKAHFSQTGKVRTKVRKKAQTLDAVDGHLFTMLVSGLDGFEKIAAPQDPPVNPELSVRERHLVYSLDSWPDTYLK